MSVMAALLLDMTLKASLLCLLGGGIVACARRGSAALRHDVWLAVLACSLLLPLAALMFRLTASALPVAAVHEAVMTVTPALPAGTPAGAIEAVDRIWSGDGAISHSGRPEAVLAALWMAGFALALLRILADHRAARGIARRARPFPAAAAVPVLVTSELDAPALFGMRRPAILMPEAAAGWPSERLRAVVAHETAHVDRHDCTLELLARLASALHWYNPLVAAAARAMRTERELACDERVLRAGLDAQDYASALVHAARGALAPPRRALLAMARPPELERRIRRLLGPMRAPAGARRAGPALVWVFGALALPASALTGPAAGVIAGGSVQPGDGPLSGLDDPLSERLPLDYDRLAVQAAAVPARGADAAAVMALKAYVGRAPREQGDLVRERALWVLAEAPDGMVFTPLAARLRDDDWRVRAYAAWGLAVVGDRRATGLLAPLLADPVWRVRAMAAAALADLGDPAAAPAMKAALGDPSWQVRISVLDYAVRTRDPAMRRHARALLRDPHAGTRLKAEELLLRH